MALSLPSRIEAILFSFGEPIEKTRLMKLVDAGLQDLRDGLDALRANLEERGLSLIETETEVELRTHPDASSDIQKLRESELSRDLGKASLETMALVLYKGGATRGEIDWVRGVNSGAAIRTLLLRGLIERTEDPGDKRRARYIATVDALAHLGVGTKEALPRYAELTKALADQEVSADTTDL